MKQKGICLTPEWVAEATRPALTTCQPPTLPQCFCPGLVKITTGPSENTAHMWGLACHPTPSKWPPQPQPSSRKLKPAVTENKPPILPVANVGSCLTRFYKPPLPRATGEPPWPQSLGTRAHTSWGFEHEDTGKWKGGILRRG